MRQIDGMKENLTKINGKLQETIMMVKKRNESNHFIQRSQAKQQSKSIKPKNKSATK